LSNVIHVINSGPPRPGWVNLPPHDYFTPKWHQALQRFTGDVLFNIQADVTPPELPGLFEAATAAFHSGDVGIYTPAVGHTHWSFDPTLLPRYADGLYAVPFVDQLCWFVHGDVIRNTEFPSPARNRCGWGIDALCAATCLRRGLRVVCDYRFQGRHPQGTGYCTSQASQELLEVMHAQPDSALVFQGATAIVTRHHARRQAVEAGAAVGRERP
jgi:hypothetical protein